MIKKTTIIQILIDAKVPSIAEEGWVTIINKVRYRRRFGGLTS